MKITVGQLRRMIQEEKVGGEEWTCGSAGGCPTMSDEGIEEEDLDEEHVGLEEPTDHDNATAYSVTEGGDKRLTKQHLRQLIKEELAHLTEANWEHRRARWDRYNRLMQAEPAAYKRWVEEQGHITPAASSVLATYVLTHAGDLKKEPKVIKKIARSIGLNFDEVSLEILTQGREGVEQGTGPDYPKTLAYTDPATGEEASMLVTTRDEMDDVLDNLPADIPYSIN